jgi:hypothetical protein
MKNAGRECWCGNELIGSPEERSQAECNMDCAGDNTQKCGAGARISLYRNTEFVPEQQPPPVTQVGNYYALGW